MKTNIFLESARLVYKNMSVMPEGHSENDPVSRDPEQLERELRAKDRQNRELEQELYAQALETWFEQEDYDELDVKLDFAGRWQMDNPDLLANQTVININDKKGRKIGELTLYARRHETDDDTSPSMKVEIRMGGELGEPDCYNISGYDYPPEHIYALLEAGEESLSILEGLKFKNMVLAIDNSEVVYDGGTLRKIHVIGAASSKYQIYGTVIRDHNEGYWVSVKKTTFSENRPHNVAVNPEENFFPDKKSLEKYLQDLDKSLEK